MSLYWFNIFYDHHSSRMPGKGIFLSVANEDEDAAKRNAEDIKRMYPDAQFVARISINLPAAWRKS